MKSPIHMVLLTALVSSSFLVTDAQACGLFYYWKWCRYQKLKYYFEGSSETGSGPVNYGGPKASGNGTNNPPVPGGGATGGGGQGGGGQGGVTPSPSDRQNGNGQKPADSTGQPPTVGGRDSLGTNLYFVSRLAQTSWEQNMAELRASIQQLRGLNELHQSVEKLDQRVESLHGRLEQLDSKVDQIDKNIKDLLELLKQDRGSNTPPANP